MSDVLYEPWQPVKGLRVPTPYARSVHGLAVDEVALSFVAAPSAGAVVDVARVAAEVNLLALKRSLERKAPKRTYADRVAAARRRTFEGPRVVFACRSCGERWDAWVDDDGRLEDPRDAFCSTERCPRHGLEAETVDDED